MKKCSVCGGQKIVKKSPMLCKKCYNKQYKRKKKECIECGKIKELHTSKLCDVCYKRTYTYKKKICSICGNEKEIHIRKTQICKNCYNNKGYCYICGKYRNICSKKMCRNCYNKKKRKDDPIFSIILKLRQRLYYAFKTYSNGKTKSDEYGIDYYAIIEYLKPFPKDIENYNIDHIFPLSAFDFNNVYHIKAAFNPKNHQWLKKEDNFKKNATYNKRKFLEYLNEIYKRRID